MIMLTRHTLSARSADSVRDPWLGSIMSIIRETPISRTIRTDPITACLQQILSVNGSVQPHHHRRASSAAGSFKLRLPMREPSTSENQGLRFRVRKTEKNIAISR
jgi:hypothetical protein